VEEVMSDDNIDLMLRHWMENVSQRLDKMSDTLECLRDQKIVVINLQEKVKNLETLSESLRVKVQELQIDMKRRAEVNKTITTPLIQKAIWAVIGTVFLANAGILFKNINTESKKELVDMLNTSK
jgi:hypothetical protein